MPQIHALRRRLGDEVVFDLIDRYRAGATPQQLAEHFGVGKTAVVRLLQREGLAYRKRGLGELQLVEAKDLRALGWSYDAIGQRLGFYGSTVWRALQ